MKAGLTTSVVMHAVLLGFGLFSLSAPKAFDVTDVEALPVDIVPIESITQIQQGDKKSPMSEKPAPKPTLKADVVPDAQKVGENKVDIDKQATPEPKPKEVTTAAVPKPIARAHAEACRRAEAGAGEAAGTEAGAHSRYRGDA